MNRTHNTFKSKNIGLITFLFLYFLYRALSDSKYEVEHDILVLIAAAIVGMITVCLNKTFKRNMLILYLAVGIFISFIFQQFNFSDTRLFMLYLAGLVLTSENEIHVTKILFITRIILLLLIFILGGFSQRNGIGAHIGNIALLYMCLNKAYFSKKQWCIIFIIIIFLAIFNPENSGVLAVLSIVLLLQIFRHFTIGRKFLCSKFTMFIYPICLFVTWFLSESTLTDRAPLIGRYLPLSFNIFYLNFVEKLNLLLGTRLSLSKTALDKIGIHLLGEDYFSVGYTELLKDAAQRNGYFLVDSGFILLLIQWGILVTILICLISIITMKYFIKKRAYNFIIVGIAFALWAILEDSLFYAFFLMFWGKAYKELRNRKTSKGESYG